MATAPRNSLLMALLIAIGGLAYALAGPRLHGLLQNTAALAIGTCFVALPLGTVLALLVVKADVFGRRLAILLIGLLLPLPLYLQAAAWLAGFGATGWATLNLNLPPLVDGWRGAIWIHAMAATPWVALIVGVGLRQAEPELEEEALLFAGRGQVFCRVTLRRSIGWLGIAALGIMLMVSGEMTVADLLQIRTFAEEIYTGMSLGEWSGGVPLPLWPTLAAMGFYTVASYIACQHLTPTVAAPMRRSLRWNLGRYRRWANIALAAILIVIGGVPLANLAYKAGIVVTQQADTRVRNWSAVKLTAIVAESPPRYAQEIGWSLIIAVCAATAAVLAAVGIAWWARDSHLGKGLAVLLVAGLLAIPGPAVGVGLIWLLNRPESPALIYLYDRTILAPWLAQCVKIIPLLFLVVWHAFATLPSDTLLSATSEGAGRWTLLRRIALPARWPAIVVSWLAGLVLAMGELAATILVIPPGMSTLPVRVFGLIHYGVEDQVAGICLAAWLFLTLLAVALWAWWAKIEQ